MFVSGRPCLKIQDSGTFQVPDSGRTAYKPWIRVRVVYSVTVRVDTGLRE